jgi:DNA-binding NtrC family response regulator
VAQHETTKQRRLALKGLAMSSESPTKSVSAPVIDSLPLSLAASMEGFSPAIIRVRAQIVRAAPYFHAAFLTGERGSGEEAAAHMLHHLSPLTAP